MKTLAKLSHLVVGLLVPVALAACSDGDDPLLPASGSRLLAASVTLPAAPGDSVATYDVTVPRSGRVFLRLEGRIVGSTTAGNSNVLEILVNGAPVTPAHKTGFTTYDYDNQMRSEPYYDTRGAQWGQPGPLWGLFWSPDFDANNDPTNRYHVSRGDAYAYEFDITGLLNRNGSNEISVANRGGWVVTAIGTAPTVILRNVSLRNE